MLPVSTLPSKVVPFNGTDVTIRSLSRNEALHLGALLRERAPNSDAYALSCAVGVSEDEAMAWLDTVQTTPAIAFLTEVLVFSGIVPEDEDNPKVPTPKRSTSGRSSTAT
jgi:hypothetical protein